MAPPSKDFIVLDKTVIGLQERLTHAARTVQDLKAENREFRSELDRLKGRMERLEERFESHKSQIDKWDTRLWSLIAVPMGGLLSLASGLIVTLARK